RNRPSPIRACPTMRRRAATRRAGAARSTSSRRCLPRAENEKAGASPPPGLSHFSRPFSVEHFEQAGAALAAADAHRDDRVFHVPAPAAFLEDVAGEARAGHAEGMADGDRAAIDVVLGRIDVELVAAVEALRGERLVQLPQVDVLDLEIEALEQARHRE